MRDRLADELRRVRLLAGVSGRELGRRVGISQSKVSRIESGGTLPTLPEVTAWGRAVGASEDIVQLLTSLTGNAYLEGHSWRAALDGTAHLQNDVRRREEVATRVRTYQPSVVPGLLQTADYARRAFSMFAVSYDDETLASAVAARMDRQLAIYRGDRRFDFLVTEAALRWRPGPPAMLRAQVDRLISVCTLDNVSLGVIVLDREALTTYSHGFVVYDDDDGGGFVTLEMIHGPLTLRSPEEVEVYRERWSLLQRMALFGDEAKAFLEDLGRHVATLSANDTEGRSALKNFAEESPARAHGGRRVPESPEVDAGRRWGAATHERGTPSSSGD